jgi:LysM repeat protein
VPAARVPTSAAIALTALAIAATPAGAAVPHTVQPGETLWSIAASNNFTTGTIAAYNGLSEDARVYAGETIEIPTEVEGAAALENANAVTAASSGSAGGTAPSAAATTTSATPPTPPPPSAPSWTDPIPCPSCPSGEAYLASNAAAAWNAMRQESLRLYGMDLYPAGPLSAYRSYGQQLFLYELYVAGRGNLAALPGSSSHEYGVALDLADPSMRTVVDQIGARYGWGKTEAPGEWWHVTYTGG